MIPNSSPTTPSWKLWAAAACAVLLLALAALLAFVGYIPGSPSTDVEPRYLSTAKATELETMFRDAGLPLRTNMQEMIRTAAGRDELFDSAKALESKDHVPVAVLAYQANAHAGHGKSARRLGELYDRGAVGIQRDYAESLRWYEVARRNGEEVLVCCRR